MVTNQIFKETDYGIINQFELEYLRYIRRPAAPTGDRAGAALLTLVVLKRL